MTTEAPIVSKREVSCLALTFFYDYLELHDISRQRLQEGLPYSPEHLNNRLNWIDFETFLVIEERIRTLLPDVPDLYHRIGRSVGKTTGFGFIRVIVRGILSPKHIYFRMPQLVRTFLFPFVNLHFLQIDRRTLRALYEFEEGYNPSEAFLQTVFGILEGLPVVIGANPAQVEMTRISERRVSYDIRFSIEAVGPFALVRHQVARIAGLLQLQWRNWKDRAIELEDANSLLYEKIEDLTEAKVELDATVRNLSILNALATAATSDLNLDRLIGRAVAVISDQMGSIPVAVLLADGEPPGLVLAATKNLEPAVQTTLNDLARPDTQMTTEILGGSRRTVIDADGVTLVLLSMQGRDRMIGALALGVEEGNRFAPALLESMAGQLAVAVESAQSYMLVSDLRDNLELRVHERTAELEDARSKLEHVVAQLERSDRARTEFFTNVSHELKTPLTLILTPLEELQIALRDMQMYQEAMRLDDIQRNARNLLRLVNEILDFARLDAGQMTVRLLRFDLGELMEEVTTYLKPLADRSEIELRFMGPETPVDLVADPDLMRRILVNLIVNAIKYTHGGDSITLKLGSTPEEVWFEVADTGPGIPRDQHRKIFERFQRATDSHGRVIEGSGIGLAMVRDILALHDGTIDLLSDVGQGTVFRLHIPHHSLPTDTQDTARPENAWADLEDLLNEPVPFLECSDDSSIDELSFGEQGSAGRILFVEDNTEMRRFVARQLSKRHEVITAVDGQQGLMLAQREIPDVVLSDVMMPRMDGYDLCRALSEDPDTKGIPVILLTAKYGIEDALEAFASGAADYVVKPFSMRELVARIEIQVRLRKLTLTLMRTETQAALGLLSAGIAHELPPGCITSERFI